MIGGEGFQGNAPTLAELTSVELTLVELISAMLTSIELISEIPILVELPYGKPIYIEPVSFMLTLVMLIVAKPTFTKQY